MKSTKITNRFFAAMVVIGLMLFTGCASDASSDSFNGPDDNELANAVVSPFSIVLKAYDAEGSDVTTDGDLANATLFVFNDQNDFVQQIPVGKSTLLQRKNIDISCASSDYITVVAWGGLSAANTEISSLSPANIISDLEVQLKQNDGIAAVPGDLFYGQQKVTRSATKTASQEVKLVRKVSSLSLVTKGLVKKYGTTEGNYEYRITGTKNAFNYRGEVTGEEVSYVFSATFDRKGQLFADTESVIPSENLTVSLYKDGELVFSTEKSKNGEKLSAKAGKQVNCVFDYSGKTIDVSVTPWNSTVQYVTLN